MKKCKARVKISSKSAPLDEYVCLLKSVYAAISADTRVSPPGAASNKSKVDICITGDDSNSDARSALQLELEGNDIPALRAALNSYLWLVGASINAYNASVTSGFHKPGSGD